MFKQLPRTLVIGSTVTLLILIFIYLFTKLPTGGENKSAGQISYSGTDKCATCHKRVTPDIVNQFA
ncbi:MAG: hypothetical protein ACYC6P_16515, partial [Ignavibacteriaceae bacterium]